MRTVFLLSVIVLVVLGLVRLVTGQTSFDGAELLMAIAFFVAVLTVPRSSHPSRKVHR